MSMTFNLPHHVRTTTLTKSNALLPLYEAIVNSFHAVSERLGTGTGRIEIIVERDLSQLPLAPTGPEPINSFEVIDDGIGFTEEHLESFKTANSPKKATVGGKGVGRFLWLKAFERVDVTSVYEEKGQFFERRFTFEVDDQGVHAGEPALAGQTEHRTAVKLIGFKNPYRYSARHSLDVLAHKILGHCLIYFLAPHCPLVRVRDEHDTIEINEVFNEEVRPRSRRRRFSVKDHEFEVSNFSVYSSGEHLIHLCADEREVNHVKLVEALPELATGKLRDSEDRLYHIASYVTGDYLNDNVSRDRTDFGFEEDALLWGGLQKSELTEAVADVVRQDFGEEIDHVAQENMKGLRAFIEDNPEFRILNSHPEELRAIPSSGSKDKLRAELYKAKNRVREHIRALGRELLDKPPDDLEEADEYEGRFVRFVSDLNELGKSELANYVIHRRVVLDLLRKAVRRAPSGKYQLEEAVHRLIFPLRATSDGIEFEQQNLWILDERLAFHRYLSSDKPLRSSETGEFESRKRPDLLIFNKPHAFAEDLYPIQSVVLVEFKRPMRNDYNEDENPVAQVYGYIRDIRAGKVVTHEGRPIDVKDSTPFHVWVVCDLTKSARDMAEEYGFRDTPDGVGMFHLHPNFNAYIELIPFEKMVDDAEKRNRILFETLNLPS
jgi:hypothetical protein